MVDYMQLYQMRQMQAKLCEPLYDAIEDCDFKKGIKLANSTKLRGIPLAQALKAYCYACNKDIVDALGAARECMAAFPTDEGTLNAVQHALRLCNKEEELGPFYESLLAKYPGSPGILSIIFNYHVRIGDGKKMQNTAQKLYKATNDTKFQFWSVASMLQQSDLPPMMLTIAEKTLAKIFFPPSGNANKIESSSDLTQPGSEEIELYLEVLLRQNKVEQALSAIEVLYSRPTGLGKGIKDDEIFKKNTNSVKMHEMRYRSLKIKLCTALVLADTLNAERITSLVDTIRLENESLLKSYPDQWQSHQQLVYIAATGKLMEQQSGPYGEGLTFSDGSMSTLVAYHTSLKQIITRHQNLRGPYLAEILLLMLWINVNGSNELPSGWDITVSLPRDLAPMSPPSHLETGYTRSSLAVLVGLVCEFIDRFQTKQCCFGDMKDKLDFIASRGESGLAWLATISGWAFKRAEKAVQTARKQILTATTDGIKGNVEDDVRISTEREKCMQTITSSSVFGQVAAYANYHGSCTLSNTHMGKAQAEEETLAAYKNDILRLHLHLQTKAFCSGGIGGERQVQPADEVLLLSAPRYRRMLMLEVDKANDRHVDADASKVMALRGKCDTICALWAVLLQAGRKASPYSHAFMLEALEPTRYLSAGRVSLMQFEALGVKHVQHDSMSYLIVPTLLETGMFKEAHHQHVQVCNFHLKAGKDTGEMIGKSFEHSNYSKGLEMKRFHSLCENSLQLAVSKAELPLIDLMENKTYAEVEAAAQYLESCTENTGGDAPLFMEFIDDEKLEKLSDNCDYSILVRCDSTINEEQAFARNRRKDVQDRIRESQLTLQLLSASLNAEPRKADAILNRWRVHLEEGIGIPIVVVDANIVSNRHDDAEIASASQKLLLEISRKVDNASTPQIESKIRENFRIPSAQKIRMGPRDATICIYTAIHTCFEFSIACAVTLEVILALDPQQSAGQDVIEKGHLKVKEVKEKATSFVIAMRALQDCMISEDNLYTSISGSKSSDTTVSPYAINCLSLFTRTIGQWMPLVLKAGLKSFPDENNSIAEKATAVDAVGSDEDTSSSEALYKGLLGVVGKEIRAVAVRGRSLIQSVRTSISKIEATLKGFHRLKPNPLFESGNAFAEAAKALDEDSDVDDLKEVMGMLEMCRTTLSKDVTDSQALSCARLLAYLDTSVQMLG